MLLSVIPERTILVLFFFLGLGNHETGIEQTLLSQSIGREFESHLVREFFIHYYTIDMLYVTPNTCYTHVYTHTGSV